MGAFGGAPKGGDPVTRYDASTAEGLRELRRAREDFLAGGLRDEVPPGLPVSLVAAWRRALFYGVVPDLAAVPRVPAPRRPSVLSAAAPVLERLDESLAAVDLAVVLSDARGRVEHVQAQSPLVRRHLERIGTGPGADLSESVTGLNGISAVVGSGRATVVRGPQHILGLYQDTACAGVPIRDPLDRRVRGVLSLVCGLEVPPVLLSTLADTAAAAIERELLHHTEPRERVLLDAFLPERSRTPAVLALDGRTRIISDPAAAVLVDPDLRVLEELAAHAVHDDRLDRAAVELPGSRRTARLREVLHGGAVAGVLITLDSHTEDAGRRPARPSRAPAASAEPAALPGLVGGSAAWVGLLRQVADADPARTLVVTGERGTGRTAVARAIGRQRGQQVVHLPGADLAADPQGGWVAELAAATERGDLVVVSDADALPDRARAALRAQLQRRADRPVVLTGDSADGAPWTSDLVPDGRAQLVQVPPLRDRTEDIGALVQALSAATLRLALDAETALARWSWPGNVAELQRVVLRLGADVGAGRPVSSADLPPQIGRGGRALSGLERAEQAAIAAALRAHQGNRSRAAAALGIGRATLYRKLRRYGLDDA